jgi:muramoyltetrapeptide carboxypeptidase
MSQRPILPPRLKRGDVIGLFCPAGPVRDVEGLRLGMALIERFGFRVRVCGPVEPREGYLADSDERRAEHLHRLWSDSEVKAVLAIRGGYGCQRMAGLIDWRLLGHEPKWLIGFSDVTVLLNALPARAGLVAVHGPMAISMARSEPENAASLFALLTGELDRPLRPKQLEILRGGSGRGRLVGGNLTTLVHTLGTPWETSWDGCVLVLEDTNEPLYRLDRMLTQLAQTGRLDRLAGLLLGDFDLGDGDRLAGLRFQEAVWSRLMELVPAGFPVWGDFPAGHRQRNRALPIGMEVSMEGGTLRLLPDSVRLA